MIPLTLAYGIGLVGGHLFPFRSPFLLFYLGALLLGLVGLRIEKWGRRPHANPHRACLPGIVRLFPLLLACVLLGHLHRSLRDRLFPLSPQHLSHYQFSRPVDLVGTLCLPPEATSGRLWLYLDVEEVSWQGRRYPVEGRARIACYGPWGSEELAYGDRLRLRRIWLRPARGLRNFGGFDYQDYLAQRGIHALGSVSRSEQLSLLSRDQGHPMWAAIYRLKGRMLAFLDRASEDPGRASLKAIVLGERNALSPEMARVFNAAGISHMLAISGQQIALVALAAFGLLKQFLTFLRFNLLARYPPLRPPPPAARRRFAFLRFASLFRYPLSLRPSKVAAFLTFWPILLYSLLVGGGHSVTRATLMVAVYLVTVMLDRPRELAHTLVLAALLILLWQPEALFDIGFQLSFAAVGGILLALSRLEAQSTTRTADPGLDAQGSRLKIETGNPYTHQFYAFLLISLYATLITLPLGIYYFQRVSLVGPLTNLVAIPLSSAAVPLGLLACLLSLIHDLLAIPCLSMSLLLFDLTYFLARTLTSLPQASIPRPSPSILALVAFYALLGSTALLRSSSGSGSVEAALPGKEPDLAARGRWAGRWGAAIAALILVFSLSWRQILPSSTDRLLRVTFLDAGPGEAALLQLPGGQSLLLLGGSLRPGRFDLAEGVIVPLLRREGVNRIDWLVAGRITQTHLRTLETLWERCEIGQVGYREGEKIPPWVEALARRKGTTLKAIRHRLDLPGKEGWRLSLLNPQGILRYGQEERIRRELPPPRSKAPTAGSPRPTPRGSRSLVLRVHYGRRSLLLAGDLDRKGQGVLLDQGEALKSDLLKIPGHGGPSCRLELLEQVRPQIAILSVESPNRFGHPVPQVLRALERLGSKLYRTDRDGAIRLVTDGQSLRVETYAELRAHRKWALVRWF